MNIFLRVEDRSLTNFVRIIINLNWGVGRTNAEIVSSERVIRIRKIIKIVEIIIDFIYSLTNEKIIFRALRTIIIIWEVLKNIKKNYRKVLITIRIVVLVFPSGIIEVLGIIVIKSLRGKASSYPSILFRRIYGIYSYFPNTSRYVIKNHIFLISIIVNTNRIIFYLLMDTFSILKIPNWQEVVV